MAVWASEKGLPPGDVFAIAQDLDGYLWLGRPTGLLRFDGVASRRGPADPASALPSGPVHAIVGSHDGSIWVGIGGGGGVVRIHRGQFVQYSTADGAPPGVTAMIQDRQGAIWVATRRGLFRFAEQPLDAARKERRLQRRRSVQPVRGSRRTVVGWHRIRRLPTTKDIFELVDADVSPTSRA